MKFFRNKINVVISLLVIIMIILILFSSQRVNKSKIEGIVGDGLNPIQKVIYNASKAISDTLNAIVNYSSLISEIENLNNENGQLKAKINSYKQLVDENFKLREILNFKDRLRDYELIGGNIIGKNNSYLNNYVIDLGKREGIQNGMVVIANGGLFGMVTSVSDNWSLVSPLTSGNVATSGFVQRTNGNQGIVRGYKNDGGKHIFKMEYLPVEEDVAIGDFIVTSGLGGIYPANILIGEVVSVENDQRNLNKNVFIKSHVNFDYVRELFVILPRDKSKVEY